MKKLVSKECRAPWLKDWGTPDYRYSFWYIYSDGSEKEVDGENFNEVPLGA
jgi:hypothetical protein